MFGNTRHPLLREAVVIIVATDALLSVSAISVLSIQQVGWLLLYIPAYLFIPGYCLITVIDRCRSYTLVERITVVAMTSIALNLFALDLVEKYSARFTPTTISGSIVMVNVSLIVWLLVTITIGRKGRNAAAHPTVAPL